jgi:hypothetical protein
MLDMIHDFMIIIFSIQCKVFIYKYYILIYSMYAFIL